MIANTGLSTLITIPGIQILKSLKRLAFVSHPFISKPLESPYELKNEQDQQCSMPF